MTQEQQVLALRLQGKSYREVMAETGLSRGRVGRIIRAAKDAPSLETETLEPPAGGSRPLSPAPAPEPASRPEAPSSQYASLFAGFLSKVREVLEDEPSKLIRQTVEGLLSDLEARSQQNLRALDLKLRRQVRDRQARPDRERKLLDGLAKQLAGAEVKLAEAERQEQACTTEHGRRRARRQVEHERDALANTERTIAWRRENLERAEREAACSN